jgi:hypothetical protein
MDTEDISIECIADHATILVASDDLYPKLIEMLYHY